MGAQGSFREWDKQTSFGLVRASAANAVYVLTYCVHFLQWRKNMNNENFIR